MRKSSPLIYSHQHIIFLKRLTVALLVFSFLIPAPLIYAQEVTEAIPQSDTAPVDTQSTTSDTAPATPEQPIPSLSDLVPGIDEPVDSAETC